MSEQLFIALTGDPGSGKTTGARHLHTADGFTEFSGSGFLKRLAVEHGVSLRERRDYTEFQRRMRLEHSQSFVADAALAMSEPRVMNVGIRNRWDVDRWHEAGGLIVAFACPVEVRFERVRGTDDKYPDNLADFIAAEAGEYDDPDPYGQHTHYAMAGADYRIDTSEVSEIETFQTLDAIMAAHIKRAPEDSF